MSFDIMDIDDSTSLARDEILGRSFVFKGEFKVLLKYQKKTTNSDFNRLPIVIIDEDHKSKFKQFYAHITGKSPLNPIGSFSKYTIITILGKAAKTLAISNHMFLAFQEASSSTEALLSNSGLLGMNQSR